MSVPENADKSNFKSLEERIESLEIRIRRIESFIRREEESSDDSLLHPVKGNESIKRPQDSEESSIESNVVENGLAWLSTVVYMFGIVFLMAFARNNGYSILSGLIGFIATGVIFLLSYALRKSFPHLVSIFSIGGLILLYYVTLRLHYFSADPLLPYQPAALILILMVIGFQIYYAIRKKSEFIATLSIILLLMTAIFSDTTHISLMLCVIAAFAGLFFFTFQGWWRLFIITILMIYMTHLVWFFSNPLMGHRMMAVGTHQYSLIYLFSYAVIISISILLPRKFSISDNVYGSIAILNALNFILLVILEVLTFYETNYVWIFGIISVLCLIFSALLRSRTDKLFSPAFYACFGFMALSICFYGYAGFPNAYFLLSFQSILVVSLALWYRSRIIAVVNTLLYLTILIGYLVMSPSINSINFMFALIALTTARILNWKSERLALRTELLRNLYLIAGFCMVLYSLSKAVPNEFVTLSWMLSALFYLLMGIILKNNKYRWMAILTILFTGFHLLIIDMENMAVGYRVIAFLFFAASTLGVSLYYTKKIKKKSNTPEV
jgi:hypothetical protein